MSISELYENNLGIKGIYNIQHISNIPSIMQNGICSHQMAQSIAHESIADVNVQGRRDKVQVPGGLKLHEYASFYFSPWNPMLSRVRDKNESICILKLALVVLDFKGVVVTNRNASSNYASFYSALDGLYNIDWKLIFAKYWVNPDPYVQETNKSIKCAEVLVPHCVPYEYVVEAAVVSKKAEMYLHDLGFNKTIKVLPNQFF